MMRILQSATIACVTLIMATSAAAQESPAVGAAAPAFRLQDQAGKWHALDDYRGKWVVLYFYPKDNTPGCTTQACEFRDNIFAYRELGAVILGVSVDDVESHRPFAEEQNLPFPILADSEKKVTTAYGTLTRYLGVVELARRDTFIIDPQGRVARHYVKVEPKGHSEMVLTELRQLATKATTVKAN
ncbi:MAG TPA: peroxiredoxin [Steroidobacteraceae bacterium]|nr:peroxiredoxin [Steroidobacteraceae bacterium]